MPTEGITKPEGFLIFSKEYRNVKFGGNDLISYIHFKLKIKTITRLHANVMPFVFIGIFKRIQ